MATERNSEEALASPQKKKKQRESTDIGTDTFLNVGLSPRLCSQFSNL